MNFSLRSALSACAALAVLAGCGPDDGAKELEQGRAAYDLRDLKKAERLFERSAELCPTNVDVLVYLARVKLDLGELAPAKEWAEKAAALAAGDLDVRLLRAQLAWHMKEYDAAIELFAGVAGDASLSAEERAQGCVGLGIVEKARGNLHLARVAFLRAIRLCRRDAAAWYHLGLLYRDDFDYPEAALEQFDTFVHLEASASPRVQKVQRKVIPDLKERLVRIAAEKPGVNRRDSAASAAAIAKAEAAAKKGNFKQARQFYEEAAKADPLSYPAALGLAEAILKTDSSKGGQQKALEQYRAACSLRTGAIRTFLTAGGLAAKLGQNAQAVAIYSRAVAAVPTSLEAIDGLIRALRAGGQGKDAQVYQAYRDSVTVRKKK